MPTQLPLSQIPVNKFKISLLHQKKSVFQKLLFMFVFVVLHFNAGGWMKIPKNVPNCTPGLECLAMLDQLFIKQGVCLTQGQTYKFVVKNNQGQGVRSIFKLHYVALLPSYP